MAYANKTTVSTEKSKAEIETMLRRAGATGFMHGWQDTRAMIGFDMQGKRVKFILSLPDPGARRFTHSSRGPRGADASHKEWEQACRSRWRALALVVKAKLEAVQAGITIFEDEFLAHIVLPSGQTVAEAIKEPLALAYERDEMQPLLPHYTN